MATEKQCSWPPRLLGIIPSSERGRLPEKLAQ